MSHQQTKAPKAQQVSTTTRLLNANQRKRIVGQQMARSEPLIFEKLWTVTDLAKHLSVSPMTIYDWVHQKRVPHFKVGSLLRFRPREIEMWLSQ